MIVHHNRKNKVSLEDYDFQTDIENRLLMAEFSVFDIDVLDEILNNSLQIEVPQLAEEVDADAQDLVPTLDKLSRTGLLTVEGSTITVDKEIRKYFDAQILKFDDRFQANMDFVQSLLAKVPIHVLPSWYAIPRCSDNIFDSVVEKYFATPKVYQRYLEELQLEDPVLQAIIDDVFAAEDFKIRSKTLCEKHGLTPEAFQEYLLHLEFNFICCLSYNIQGDEWLGVVTPFHEWRQYLRHLRDTESSALPEEEVTYAFDEDFPFIKDMTAALQQLQQHPTTDIASLASIRDEWKMSDEDRNRYLEDVVGRLVALNLVERSKDALKVTDLASEWFELNTRDRAVYLYRQPNNCLALERRGLPLANLRNIREAEKSVCRIKDLGWVLFDDFVEGVLQSVADCEGIRLVKKGKRWHYNIPKHSPVERELIYYTIFERLYQVGMVNIGQYQGKPCFKVTAFGREALS